MLEAVEPFRDIEVRLADGQQADVLLHQIRTDGEKRFVFLCNTDRIQEREQTSISLKGDWKLTVLDTLTGDHFPLASERRAGHTVARWNFPAHGSLLLLLEPGWIPAGIPQPVKRWSERDSLQGPMPVTLSEPNVLLLDQARYRLDDESWQPREEVLRIDNLLRERLGYPLKMEAFAQPWTDGERQPPDHRVRLAFPIQAHVTVCAPRLALEDAHQVRIFLNGQEVAVEVDGWFVDEAIHTVPLPDLAVGTHELVLERPYDRQTNLEWCYLLGDFGVAVQGQQSSLVAPVRTLHFGDWTNQGLPFYAGNVTYHYTLTSQGEELTVHIPHFKSPLL